MGEVAAVTRVSASDGKSVICHAMTVDVEDYFQVSMFEKHIQREQWDDLPSRVEQSTERVLELFSDAGVKGTFFVLGWIAERHRRLVRDIVDEGHELASHGYAHVRVMHQTPEQFQDDVTRTKMILEDISGTKVIGYRAASYSITDDTPWAYDALAEAGYLYSSSLYPIKHDLYGRPDGPRFAHYPAGRGGIVELPVATLKWGSFRLPCGGGGYFRLYPYVLTRWLLRLLMRRESHPAIFYFHPWELDPEQPRVPSLPFKTRFRHYLNLNRVEKRLRSLLGDFKWDRIMHVFSREITGNHNSNG